jgi:hypothetical protein
LEILKQPEEFSTLERLIQQLYLGCISGKENRGKKWGITPELRRLRLEDQEFKVSLGYILRSCHTHRPHIQNK